MTDHDVLLDDPRVRKSYGLLEDLGVFSYIDKLKQRERHYEKLISASVEIFRQTSIDDLLAATVSSLSEFIHPSFLVFLWKPRPGRGEYVVRGFRDLKEADIAVPSIDLSKFEAFFQKRPGPIELLSLKASFEDKKDIESMENVGAEIIIPIIGPSGLVGLILIGPKLFAAAYSRSEIAFIQRLMSFTAIAIQNHLHYEYSVRDPKTGLFNHAFFMVRLNEEISRSRRAKRPFCVIVFDVDQFKSFNDGYGHLAGDRVLEALAEALKANVRDVDVLARFGGEEFTVLLPETERLTAWDVAERLRIVAMELDVDWPQTLPNITISAGLAEYQPSSGESAARLLSRADEALYSSKDRGRNRTTVWGGGLFFRSNIVLDGRIGETKAAGLGRSSRGGLYRRSRRILAMTARLEADFGAPFRGIVDKHTDRA